MVFLNVLFLLVLFVITFAGIAALVTCVLTLFGKQRKARWIIATFVVYCCCLVAFFFVSSRPSAVFERQLGFPPPSIVHNLKSSQWILGDYGKVTLSFIANQKTLDQIVKHKIKRMPDIGKTQHFHRKFSKQFATETEDVYFNKSTGRISYTWIGVD
ncbi:hypothetical protein V202x_37910 [Gimesia aquarii]|uniref:Uncharacterized protein n=1 Tax=Gimesia aquarii TaxID=2527964 RepID=A0A517WYQ9_9PLAN|nr:hypothetical protein V202x_37910 [Gimesia aquarii]